jgi:DNA repair protein RecN (Recombination protein N)
MLQEIHLTNFTLIDHLHLSLPSHMIVITGETGAGKSIIITAIELALGSRLEGKVVGKDGDRCDISLCFDIHNNKNAQAWLKEHDLIAEDWQCVIRRMIGADGRSRCYINGHPMTLQNITELGRYLISIHGQHQQQALLKRDEQRILLDDYAGLQEQATKVKKIYHEWYITKEKIEQLTVFDREQLQRREFLLYQLNEFNKLALANNELEQLNEAHKKLANADNLQSNCQQALNYLSEQERNCVLDLLQAAIRSLQANKMMTSQLENCLNLLNISLVQIREACDELQAGVAANENNPEQLQTIEERLAVIYELARKHRIAPEQLLNAQMQLQNELQRLENSSEELQEQSKKLADLEQEYFREAKQLSEERRRASEKLSHLVTSNMQTLDMNGGRFAVILINNESIVPQAHGFERVEFQVSGNPGQPLQPLNKVASGGELSRISLALEVIIAQNIAIPTLIFDEVDVGIGGKTSAVVGRMLRELGQSTQVFCITHQAQVAAQGNHHLCVIKNTVNGVTLSKIDILERAERIEEIARMLGGIVITPQTLAHAEEMMSS